MSEKEGSVTGHTNTEEVKPEDDEIDPIVTQNYLMDIGCLNIVFEKMCICKKCKGNNISVSEGYTLGVGSIIDFKCADCEHFWYICPSESMYSTQNRRGRPSMLYFNNNIEVLMSCLYMGCGPREVSFLLSSLHLPKVHRFVDQYYANVDSVTKPIREVAKDYIARALNSEIRAAFRRQKKHKNPYLSNNDLDGLFHEWYDGNRNDSVGLRVAYDMGWQKKSSGKRYDSLSGHCFLFGLDTKKIIGMKVYSKVCSVCDAKRKGPVPEHECPKNWEGSSGAMESQGALELWQEIYDKYDGRVYFEHFLSDDDSTTRAILSKTKDNKKGCLPDDCRSPTFWADVNHRIKCMAKPMFQLAALPDKISDLTKTDALRLKRNLGWYIQTSRKNNKVSFDQFVANIKAPIAHHFHSHEWCDSSWCPFKGMDEAEMMKYLSKQSQSTTNTKTKVFDVCRAESFTQQNVNTATNVKQSTLQRKNNAQKKYSSRKRTYLYRGEYKDVQYHHDTNKLLPNGELIFTDKDNSPSGGELILRNKDNSPPGGESIRDFVDKSPSGGELFPIKEKQLSFRGELFTQSDSEDNSEYCPPDENQSISSSINSSDTDNGDNDNGEEYDKSNKGNDDDVKNFLLQAEYLQSDQKEVFFSMLPAEKAKQKELQLANKGKGHYRSMIEDEDLYHQLLDALEPFIKEDMLKMLWHRYDTNVNEAMNRSVSSFAPKDRTFCRTMSLQTRVSIAAGVQILGHYRFWKEVLAAHGIQKMGDSMENLLRNRDRENKYRNEYRKKTDVKKKRKHGENTTINKGIIERKNKISNGTYKSGVAIRAEQLAKAAVDAIKEKQKKNKKKSKKQKKVCKYYPHFCKIVGHTSARCKECEMYGTSEKKKREALRSIEKRMVDEQIQRIKSDGTSFLSSSFFYSYICDSIRVIYFYDLFVRIHLLYDFLVTHMIILCRCWYSTA